jgi:hypothetical protein
LTLQRSAAAGTHPLASTPSPLTPPSFPPCRIFVALGHPGTQAQWAHLDSLRHWRDDTQSCRTPKPEHGSINLKQMLWENSPLLR